MAGETVISRTMPSSGANATPTKVRRTLVAAVRHQYPVTTRALIDRAWRGLAPSSRIACETNSHLIEREIAHGMPITDRASAATIIDALDTARTRLFRRRNTSR